MRKDRLRLILFIILIFVITVLFAWLVWPQMERMSFENHYLGIAEKLNRIECRNDMRSLFEREYNFTELYEWVHEKVRFVPLNETFERNTEPAKILKSGKGRCEEFSILYAAACLAHGYFSRLVVAVDESNPMDLNGLHVWVEVKLNGWVHVDPSDRVWNDPYRYEGWDWGEHIGSKVRIYAFEEGKCEDVSTAYRSIAWAHADGEKQTVSTTINTM